MVEQRTIMVHDTTSKYFRKVKVNYQAFIGKEISDNQFILDLLKKLESQIKGYEIIE